MEIVRGIQELSHSFHHPVVTLGNFDGVHLGHKKILETAREKAVQKGGDCIVYTFRPHPQIALRSGSHVQLLSTYDEKLELIGSLGINYVIEEPFTREFSTTEPNRFFTDILLHHLSVEAIVVGYDFAFGKERHGHLEVLTEFCKDAGVELTVVPPQRADGEVVSSSKIREHLLEGRIQDANRLLGREFCYRGVVMKGNRRGRLLGFPTANLRLEDKLALPFGVYATMTVCGNKKYPSVTNVGVRPTFQVSPDKRENPIVIETHLLDTTVDLYGSSIEVRFVQHVRAERKFNGPDELKAQIAADIQKTREILR